MDILTTFKKPLSIGAFLVSVIVVNMAAGNKATYYYLLLVFVGVLVVNVDKLKIK